MCNLVAYVTMVILLGLVCAKESECQKFSMWSEQASTCTGAQKIVILVAANLSECWKLSERSTEHKDIL